MQLSQQADMRILPAIKSITESKRKEHASKLLSRNTRRLGHPIGTKKLLFSRNLSLESGKGYALSHRENVTLKFDATNGLLTNSESLEKVEVLIRITITNIVKQATTAGNHSQQSASC